MHDNRKKISRSVPGRSNVSSKLTGISHPLVDDLKILDRYQDSRSMRLAFLVGLKESLGILQEDAGALFRIEFKKLPVPAQKEVIRELKDGRKDRGDLLISFAPGMQINGNCNWNQNTGTLDGVFMPVGIENRAATRIIEHSNQAKPLYYFVDKMIAKLNGFLEKEGSGFFESAPQMLLPKNLNSLMHFQRDASTTEFSLFVAFRDIGPVNVSKILKCHMGEIADPGAGGCEAREQALTIRLPEVLTPYLNRYISALEFRVNLIASLQHFIENRLLEKNEEVPISTRLKFDGMYPPDLTDTNQVLRLLKQKLNPKLSTLQIDFKNFSIETSYQGSHGNNDEMPYHASVSVNLLKKPR